MPYPLGHGGNIASHLLYSSFKSADTTMTLAIHKYTIRMALFFRPDPAGTGINNYCVLYPVSKKNDFPMLFVMPGE